MNVLFLCTGNACRSQMAEGFARHRAPDGVQVYSAGTRPAGIDPRTIEVMAEAGIDIRTHASKPVTSVPLDDIGLVVTLCRDADETCAPLIHDRRHDHWPLPDPARAQGTEALDVFRRIRDDIAARVAALWP